MRIKKDFIPNFISLSSILCGFIAIVMASHNQLQFAGTMILLGALFDGLDGTVARALKTTSNIGKEMDSLADLSTFGLAGGYLLYQGSLYQLGTPGILVATLIPLCAAIRLARFNVKPLKRYFEGLPTTWVGITIAILTGYFRHIFSLQFIIIFTVCLSFLMVSKFKYYKVGKKHFEFSKRKVIILILLVFFLFINFQITLLSMIFWYSLSGVIFSFFRSKPKIVEPYKVKY